MSLFKILPEIPPQKYSYQMRVQFVTRWDERDNVSFAPWYIFGPAEMMELNAVVEVESQDGSLSHVTVLEHVAERDVKKASGETVRFVLANFDRCVEEDTS